MEEDIKQERRMGGGEQEGGVGPQLSMEEDIKQERRMGGGGEQEGRRTTTKYGGGHKAGAKDGGGAGRA